MTALFTTTDLFYLKSMCIVATRYQGVYEGGAFAVVPIDALKDGGIFGEDLACSDWWEDNEKLVSVGNTPEEAFKNWVDKLPVKLPVKVTA